MTMITNTQKETHTQANSINNKTTGSNELKVTINDWQTDRLDFQYQNQKNKHQRISNMLLAIINGMNLIGAGSKHLDTFSVGNI